MLVELDVFSGRPNPRWQLDESSARELRRFQGRLAVTTVAAPEPPALGYRGFVYSDLTEQRRVYKGFLRTTRSVFADPKFSIERFLLDRLPVEYASLGRRIAATLARPG